MLMYDVWKLSVLLADKLYKISKVCTLIDLQYIKKTV